MAYRDWLKEYRESQGSQTTPSKKSSEDSKTPSGTSGQSTSGSSGSGGSSFRDTLNAYRDEQASKSMQGWAETSINLIKDSQNRSGDWFDDDEYKYQSDRFTRLLSQADSWRKQYSDNSSAVSYINSVVDALSEAKNYTYSTRKYYSQWKTADDYKSHLAQQKDYEEKKSYDLTAGQKEIDTLKTVLAEAQDIQRQLNAFSSAQLRSGSPYVANKMAELNGRLNQITSQYGGVDELETLVNQKNQYLNQAKHIQEGITLAGVINNDDFKDKSGYASTKSEGVWDNLTSQFGMGYDDLTYEYINGLDNGMRQEILNKAVSWDADTEKFSVYDHMTADQISTYNYYYAKDGKEAAEKYLDSIRETLNYQAASERFGKMEGNTALELLFGVGAGLDQFKSGMKNLFNTEDDYIAQTATQMASGMVREDLADDGFKILGNSLGQIGYDAITTTTNMAPSILTSIGMNIIAPGSGAVVGTAMMGASAAGNAYQEALNKGFDKDQARGYSTLVGASEAVLGYLLGGVSKLGGKLSNKAIAGFLSKVDDALLRTAGQIGGNMISEFTEEYLQEVLTPVFSNLMLGTDEEINLFSAEALYSGLLGALTAGIMEGPTTIAGEVKNYKTGKQLQAADISAQRLAELGQMFSADTVAHQLAGRVNEKTGAYTMGRLFNEIGATLTEQNVTEITEALVAKGMDEATAKKNAEALAYVVEGGQLTDRQIAVIEANEILAEVARTTLIDANTTWNQRSKGYNEMLKSLADEMAAPKASRTNPAQQSQENAPTVDTVDTQSKEGVQSLSEPESVDTSPAKVQTISSIEKGQATVKLEDGTEVNVKQADLSVDDGVRIETIAKLEGITATDANFVLNTLRTNTGASAQMDSLGAREVWKYGYYGFSQEHMTTHGVFANSLTESQRKAIYETARSARQRQVEAKQATVSKKENVATGQKVSGKVHFDGDRSTLTERQSASLTAMEKIANALGVQIYVFESELNERGKRVGANGWYDPKDSSIHIDLHAGANGEGTMLFTLAHELTHHIRKWSPAKFKTLADFLMQEYGKKGVSVDALVREQMAKAKRNRPDYNITYDIAYEEVVADSMETMLSDGNVMKRLEKLKAQDKDLWYQIKKFIDDLATKIRNIYKGLRPDSVEGRYVADMGKAVYKLQELFAEALVEASENYQDSLTPGEEGTIVNENGDPVAHATEDGTIQLSMRTYEEEGREAFRKYLQKCVKNKRLTRAEMKEMLDGIEDIYMTCKEFKDKYAPFSSWSDAAVVRDTYGKPVFSVVTPNGDYKMNLDFSLVCKKRRTLDAVFNEMSKRGIIDDFELGQKSVVKINEIIRKYGLETACALCFVDAKRFRQASMADQFTSLYNELVLSLVPEEQRSSIEHFNFSGYETIKKVEGGIHTWDASKLDFSHLDEVMKNYGEGTVEYKAAKYIKANAEGRKLLLRGDFMSSKGFDAVKTQNPDVLKLYNSKKGTGGPKAAFGDVQYLNEIIQKAQWWTPEKAYAVGGVRVQSFSDYVPRMVFDYVQMIYDLAATKLPAHAYTKEALFVKQFGLTGIKINMSLIPAIAEGGIAPGLDANGNYVWAGESFDFETAKEIQKAEGYTENCGTICVGVSDRHIRKLLSDPDIRMVIPYHKSGLNPIVAHMNKIAEFTDYTNKQNTTVKATGSKAEEHFDFNEALHKMGKNADPRAVIQQYFDWCDERGYDPKFADFRDHPNYYKLIEDFTLYDMNGQYVPQREVRAVFPKEGSAFGSMKDLIQAGLEEDAIVEGKRDSSLSAIVDEIQKTLPKTEAEISEDQVEQADRDLEAEEISDAHVKWSLRDEAPPKKTKIGYKAFFVKDGKLYPPMVANPSGAGTPVGVWLNADTGTPMRDSEGNLLQNKSGRAKVAAGGKGTKGGGGSLAWRPGWHLGPIPDATQFSVDPESKEWSEWLQKTGKTAGETKNIGNKGNPIFLNPHIVFAEVEFAADVDYQLEAYEYGVNKKGNFDHSQAGIPYIIKDGYYRYRTNSMAPGALSWYITGAMKVNRILTDAECREICAKSGRDMMPRLGGDFDFEGHKLTAGDVTPTEDLSGVAPKQDFSDEVMKLPGYVRRKLNFSDPNFRKAFEDDSIADMVDYYEDLYNKTDALKFSDRDSEGKQLTKEQQEFFKDSKARDKDGNLLRLYHGTEAFGFTMIDFSKSDDGRSFFMTDNPVMAESYSGTRTTRSVVDHAAENRLDPHTAPIDDVVEEYNLLTDRGVKPLKTKAELYEWADKHLTWANSEIERMVEMFDNLLPRWENEVKDVEWGKAEDLAAAMNVFNSMAEAYKLAANAVTADEMDAAHDALFHANKLGNDLGMKNIYYMMFSPVLRPIQVAQDLGEAATALRAANDGKILIANGNYYVFDEQSLRDGLEEQYLYASEDGEVHANYELYANLTNPLIIEAKGSDWDNIRIPKELRGDFALHSLNARPTRASTRDFSRYAKNKGYDGVIIRDVVDYGANGYDYYEEPATVVIAFESNQVKDAYNKNPTTDPDIRYSDRDSDGNQLSKDQQEFFKDSKVRDSKGNLIVLYHGTSVFDNITEFRTRAYKANRAVGLWLSDSHHLGALFASYMGDEYIDRNMETAEDVEIGNQKKGGVYKLYANLTNPLVVDALVTTEENFGGVVFKNYKQPFYHEIPTPEEMKAAGEKAATVSGEEIATFARAHGYDGVIIKNVKEGYGTAVTDVIAFEPNQVKYADNRKPTSSNDIRYSDRDSDSVSNRSLLANAFEGVAQNDIERNKIQEYKGKISLIESEERKLSELNEQIKNLSFSKGPRDAKAIRDLQFEAKQTANRISTYDKQLLRLEASKPLQDVLQREKKMAYHRAEKKGKEALAAYRERATKTQRELMDKWQESRKKGIESRQKTAMRHKIKDIVNELNQYLLRGTKDRHVPIELQKAVAEALDAVNMDTVGAEERIAKLQAELLKAKTPEQIQEISRKIDHIREMGDKMNGRLKKLKDAYDQFVNSDDPLIANSHDDVISNKLQSVIESVGDTPLRDMTVSQLEDVYDMYRMVLTTIRNANKAFKAKKSESISVIANQVMVEVEKVGGKKKLSMKGTDGIKGFFWNNLKPVYAFEHIGSDHFTEVFNNVRAGEDVWALDVTEAREFYLDKSKKHNYDSWDFKKRYTFTSTSGMEFSLDLEQIMSLYAYSKRDQAADHLKKGGIVIDETTEITVKNKLGIPVKFNPTEATAYNISDATLAEIISKLTAEQRDFVDVMQDYLSTVMGAKGNEVSLEMYGVKLFKEKFYFPLKSAQQFMAKAKEQQKGEVKIKNSGFSKETVQKASNPIVLTPFMNVWADHVNEMSMYHAFVLPMEDFYRVYNYKTPTSDTMATESVEMFIQNAYGKGATKYIDQLLKDLNGGARTDHTTGIINKMMGLFKKGAVFASLSVVVQQPSAIARAAALVNTKYFIGPKVDHKRHKALWDEVKQYAPVAIIKEMGYFDTNMGKSTQDFILGKEYSGFKEKMKALVTDSGYRDEALSKAPALADELAWCSIWEAVKREMHDKYPGLDVKGEPFLMLAGSRFTEVITKTQVYDSVLSRSGLMRSKDTGMKMATAFMAEPTTSINMITDALLQGKRGNKKYARAAIGAVIASQILNSILVSFVYAGRDDDEDETYAEKYIGTLSGEILDSMNPATYIPFIKDIVSIVQGYDVERSDMAVISDLWKAWENLSKDYISPYRKVEGFVGSIAQIFGLPVKNIMRDVRGIYQTIDSLVNGQQTTKAGIGYAVKGAITGKTVSDQQQLYEAYLSGDQAHISRVESRYKDQSAVHSALRKALRENDPRILEAAIAWNANDLDEYMRLAKAIIAEKHFIQDDVVMAIRAEANALTPDTSTSGTSKAKGLFTAEKFVSAIAQGDEASANAAKLDIIQTAQTNGKTEEEAEKSFVSSVKSELKEQFLEGTITDGQAIDTLIDYCGETQEDAEEYVGQWAFEQEYGFSWSDRGDAYKSGQISADELRDILVNVGGKTREEAMWQVKIYDWQNEGFDIDSNQKSVVEDYETYCEPAGIDKGTYFDAYLFYKDSGEDGVAYSKTVECMPYINSLPLTSSQKTALAMCWWAESTVRKYKTW